MELEDLQDLFKYYTQADALRDGLIVDASDVARELGITFPVRLTAEFFDAVVRPAPAAGQTVEARIWDLMWALVHVIRGEAPRHRERGPGRCETTTFRCPFQIDGEDRMVEIKALCGPGDNAEPVITLFLPEELEQRGSE